jgi:integrase
VKLIVASRLSEQGEPENPRTWNSNFLDLPIIGNQRQPCFSSADVVSIIKASNGQRKALYALLAGSGLRIGEAIGLEKQHISSDFRIISVRQSVYNGIVQSPKTSSGVREVDLSPELADLLKGTLGPIHGGFVFHTSNGSPLHQSNLLRRDFHPLLRRLWIEKQGFHGFRRFRVTCLRKQRTSEDLLKLWLGHSSGNITDRYSKVGLDISFRQEVSARTGLGFELS